MPRQGDKFEFDGFASTYDEALKLGLSATGEDKSYFAERRVSWLASELASRRQSVSRIVDFGCGTGSTSQLLNIAFGATVLGLDVSEASLALARRSNTGADFDFARLSSFVPTESFDLVYCNGVFHHILPKDRAVTLRYVHRLLRPGGYFAVWENNPWNPGTRYVMSRIPFDAEAGVISADALRRLLQKSGFVVESTTFHFIFPRFLAWMRPMERMLRKIPLGGQYQILGRKPKP